MKTVKIGTRESKLAVVQAELVAAGIRAAHPELATALVTMKTTGDKILDVTLDKVGGKGLFIKELDEALRRGDADICAHSYKDMPSEDNPELPVVAVGPREDPADVLILPKGVTELDQSLPIGCSSLRRRVQVEALYPGQPVAPVRGNIVTRLEKLDRGEYAALVLAAAGIKRIGLWERVSHRFTPDEMLPAGSQGVIAVQGRAGEDHSYLTAYHDADAWDATTAERAFQRRLDAGCGAPVGAFATVEGSELRLRGLIVDARGGIHRDEISGSRGDARELGYKLADTMLERAGSKWQAQQV